MDIALTELGIIEIAGLRIKGGGHGTFAVPLLAMAWHTLIGINRFPVLSPGSAWDPEKSNSQEQSGRGPDNKFFHESFLLSVEDRQPGKGYPRLSYSYQSLQYVSLIAQDLLQGKSKEFQID
jgi:hypothetical protein